MTTPWVGIVGVLSLIVILAFVFTADDLTGIGYLMNPIEFIFLGVLGYYGGKKVRR